VKVAVLYWQLANFGGAERVVLSIAKHFNSTVFTGFYDPKKTYPQFGQIKVQEYGSFFKNSSFRMYEAAFESMKLDLEGFDVINPHNFPNSFVSLRFGSRTVWYCHAPMRAVYDLKVFYSSNLPDFKKTIFWSHHSLLELLDKAALKRIPKILTNSEVTKKRIQKYYHKNSVVVYPGINTELYRKESFEDFVLFVGGLSRYSNEANKRPELAIDAMRLLKDKQLLIVGGGANKPYLEAHSPDNVKFLGNVSDKTLIDLYARCSAVIYPSYDEEYGYVPVEAMASGKPVIACRDGGGVCETVLNKETGFIVNPNSREIANAVNKLKDKKLLLQMSENAKQRSLLFSENKFIEGIKENFENLS
jgi:glycosyltransferase involved in cell wall biosynthesis